MPEPIHSNEGTEWTAGDNVTLTFTDVDGDYTQVTVAATGASGAPANADYLVGTANGSLSNEIVVGATPGGELGGTWASPTVDATHSGSAHHSQSHADTDHIDPPVLHAIADATGDLLVASGANTFARLALGGDGNVLTVSGGTASWQAPGAGSHPAYASHAKFGVD